MKQSMYPILMAALAAGFLGSRPAAGITQEGGPAAGRQDPAPPAARAGDAPGAEATHYRPAGPPDLVEAGPATLGVDEIIRGIAGNEAAWGGPKGWMVRYRHARERLNAPPGSLIEFPDHELVNARKGLWAFARVETSSLDSSHVVITRIYLWRDGKAIRKSLGVQDRSPPGEDVLAELSGYFWYNGAFFRDPWTDFPLPASVLEVRDAEAILPFLKAHEGSFRVRGELEVVGGVPCHVLEDPGKDVIWVAAKHGFMVARRIVFQPSGRRLYETKCSKFAEKAPGIWLPERVLMVTYPPDEGTPEAFRGLPMSVIINTLVEARFDVPDDLFKLPGDVVDK